MGFVECIGSEPGFWMGVQLVVQALRLIDVCVSFGWADFVVNSAKVDG